MLAILLFAPSSFLVESVTWWLLWGYLASTLASQSTTESLNVHSAVPLVAASSTASTKTSSSGASLQVGFPELKVFALICFVTPEAFSPVGIQVLTCHFSGTVLMELMVLISISKSIVFVLTCPWRHTRGGHEFVTNLFRLVLWPFLTLS